MSAQCPKVVAQGDGEQTFCWLLLVMRPTVCGCSLLQRPKYAGLAARTFRDIPQL
jgi:hypothetical protein